MLKKVLVTGSGGMAGIGFTRCIKSSPEKFFMVGTDSSPMYIHLSETNVKVLVPPSTSKDYVDILNYIISKYGVEFIHAQPDAEIDVIAANKEKIDATTFMPSYDVIRKFRNKYDACKVWERKGIPTPRSILIKDEKDVERAFEELGSKIWLRSIYGAGARGSFLARSYEHARSWVDYWDGWGTFMASSYLPGPNYGCDMIFKEGQLVAITCKERLEYVLPRASPSGVTGTSAISRPAMEERAMTNAIKAVTTIDPNPNGVYSVDLKGDDKGMPCVTEVNPARFLTASLHLFYKCGCLLPYVYVKLAYKEDVRSVGVRWPLKPDFVLIRSLDSEPAFVDSKVIERLIEEREKKGYAILA